MILNVGMDINLKDGSSPEKAFEEQREERLIACPVCGSTDIEQLPSSLRQVSRNSGQVAKKGSKDVNQLKLLEKFKEYINKNFDNVGDRFAETAIKIHNGKEDPRNIKGTATKQEEELLKEEGVMFLKIPFPKLDS